MDDEQFTTKLNTVLREDGSDLPRIGPDSPSAAQVASWASFLESCVRRGIKLSDPRWKRLTLRTTGAAVSFVLQGEDRSSDEDFRIGLALLVGMFDEDDDADNSTP